MGQLSVWYDEEGDFLEVRTDDDSGHFNDLGDGVFERVDEDGNTVGFALVGATSRESNELPFDATFRKQPS